MWGSIPITGGQVAGRGWTASVLPGGADFQLIVSPRMAELDARYTLETDAGELIFVQNRAIRVATPELTAKLVRGEPLAGLTHPTGRRALLATAAALLCAGPLSAHAQNAYPTRSVRLIVGFPAGTGPDIVARLVGQKLSETWGMGVVVDNKPGAGA